ncbi:PREDICTED: extensin-like [Camelina sativa]|uniref:Extensin-like n=1 Tax=Camelina sativa TaxID=90675 RepID=A0ABM1RPV4_CAMSA|nr:PREDICTED: extensin-like [Camelina sativa]
MMVCKSLLIILLIVSLFCLHQCQEPNPDRHEPDPDRHEPDPDRHEPDPDRHEPDPDRHEPDPDHHEPDPDRHEPDPDRYEPDPDRHEPDPDRHEPDPDRHKPDPDHPKGIERCFHKYSIMGEPWQLEYLCCIKKPSICTPVIFPEDCIKCPSLTKDEAPSPSVDATLPHM